MQPFMINRHNLRVRLYQSRVDGTLDGLLDELLGFGYGFVLLGLGYFEHEGPVGPFLGLVVCDWGGAVTDLDGLEFRILSWTVLDSIVREYRTPIKRTIIFREIEPAFQFVPTHAPQPQSNNMHTTVVQLSLMFDATPLYHVVQCQTRHQLVILNRSPSPSHAVSLGYISVSNVTVPLLMTLRGATRYIVRIYLVSYHLFLHIYLSYTVKIPTLLLWEHLTDLFPDSAGSFLGWEAEDGVGSPRTLR